MKYGSVAMAALCLALCCAGAAGAAEISLSAATPIYQESENDIAAMIRLTYGGELYLWGSHESATARYAGQEMGFVDLYGLGAGARMERWGFMMSLGIGYYHPQVETAGNAAGEALRARFHDMLDTEIHPGYDDPEYDLSGNIGGYIGIAYRKEIGKFFVAIGVDYRFLRLSEDFVIRCSTDRASWLEGHEERDFSAFLPVAGIGFRW